MAELSFRNVSVVFGSGRHAFRAVNDVSLTIPAGSITGLVGESGSGKSTLAKAAVGLVKISAGSIELDGTPVGAKASRRRIQMVFQNPYGSLDPRMSIGASIKEGLVLNPRKDLTVPALLDMVGIDADREHLLPRDFSGGQRQRIAIARALAAGPEVLVADEISSALDVSVQGTVLNLIKDLQRELGFSVLFISHDLPVVRFMSDYIAVMNHGVLVEHGPRDQVLLNPTHSYTKFLLGASPKPGTRIDPNAGPDLEFDPEADEIAAEPGVASDAGLRP